MEDTINFADDLVALVKQKPELAALDDVFVLDAIKKALTKKVAAKLASSPSFVQFRKSGLCKSLVSDTRKVLREVYGVFIKTPLRSQTKLFSRISSYDDEELNDMLLWHQSTMERAPFYTTLYPNLFSLLHEQGLSDDFVLADFACGYNPLAYKFLPIKPTSYVACDLSSEEMLMLNDFFKRVSISGEVHGFDLLSESFSSWLTSQSFDVVFLFKALDSLEAVKRNSSKKLLPLINTKFFVVSFALVSIGGKASIAGERRMWFESFCNKQGWSWSKLQIANEVFYVVKKE